MTGGVVLLDDVAAQLARARHLAVVGIELLGQVHEAPEAERLRQKLVDMAQHALPSASAPPASATDPRRRCSRRR